MCLILPPARWISPTLSACDSLPKYPIMKKLILTVVALAASLTLVTAADAEKKANKGAALTPEERFKKLDTDGDGFISLDEFKAGPQGKKDPAKAEEIFKKKDKNGDGKLSPEEFAAGGKKKADAAAPAKDSGAPKADTAAPKADAPAAPAEKK